MSAMPSLAARLPEPVFYALARAAEVTTGASTCLSIMSGILNQVQAAAKGGRDLDPGDVDAWREQLEWLLEQLASDLDALRSDVLATGIRHPH